MPPSLRWPTFQPWTSWLRIPGPPRPSDEFGRVQRALQTAIHHLRATVQAVAGSAARMEDSAQSLSTASWRLSASTEQQSQRAAAVGEAGGRISRSVQAVATGSEEMTSSIREIARNATEAAKSGRDAVGAAGNANETVERLGASSAEIGNVIKLITSIAEQTNLLALNATIEAARAGDAGKGFAVVAGEVKDLAQESAKAAEGISQKIENIQGETSRAVAAIAGISELIAHINEYQTTIASAVEEQAATSRPVGPEASSDATACATRSALRPQRGIPGRLHSVRVSLTCRWCYPAQPSAATAHEHGLQGRVRGLRAAV
ncbi:MAG: methyl-accepting chemotaxis protein [Micromonosporaceae bacterium]|nr:methyl-accepting chemotaxis protein [Micromonosporaceae bacterium]